ncbi:sulfite exporter TauE/SafE family protein [Foetidibacter luteolus]|uniref:sulfite exporter TauE/SafE family protein n=1 Tax=Foetidibacter luteolus TaxID=2608880 RepID=UPI00129B3AC6|nr:sulfite exporter TauE/SafE family protein [Foetidibacter luteolus]
MEILGYIASLLIGISLGLIGSGGSILTMPVMVYLFGIQPLAATSYSLFVVGSTSLVGAVQNYKRGLVNLHTALLFGASSVFTVFVTRRFFIPLIPGTLFSIGSLVVTENMLTMLLFAALMILAAISMMRKEANAHHQRSAPTNNTAKLLLYGIGIGFVTGLLGAGGGFLLIPTLVMLAGIPIKEAIGTSLLIIALNSLIGFTGDLQHQHINWRLMLVITALATPGIFIGNALNKKISSTRLKKAFGWFILAMGLYIVANEVFGSLTHL